MTDKFPSIVHYHMCKFLYVIQFDSYISKVSLREHFFLLGIDCLMSIMGSVIGELNLRNVELNKKKTIFPVWEFQF